MGEGGRAMLVWRELVNVINHISLLFFDVLCVYRRGLRSSEVEQPSSNRLFQITYLFADMETTKINYRKKLTFGQDLAWWGASMFWVKIRLNLSFMICITGARSVQSQSEGEARKQLWFDFRDTTVFLSQVIFTHPVWMEFHLFPNFLIRKRMNHKTSSEHLCQMHFSVLTRSRSCNVKSPLVLCWQLASA